MKGVVIMEYIIVISAIATIATSSIYIYEFFQKNKK
jgi:hypothetical protein